MGKGAECSQGRVGQGAGCRQGDDGGQSTILRTHTPKSGTVSSKTEHSSPNTRCSFGARQAGGPGERARGDLVIPPLSAQATSWPDYVFTRSMFP